MIDFRQLAAWGRIALLGILLTACSHEEIEGESVEAIDEYFDVQGFLAEKEDRLREMKVVLQKKATFSGVVEQTTINLDSAVLAEELDVFREVDINKPVFSGRYLIEKERIAGKEVITYQADEPDELNINFLKVYMDAKGEEVERLEALFSSKNVLYSSTRLIRMQYGQVDGENLPVYYQVEGSQKMIFNDKENYVIKADFEYAKVEAD